MRLKQLGHRRSTWRKHVEKLVQCSSQTWLSTGRSLVFLACVHTSCASHIRPLLRDLRGCVSTALHVRVFRALLAHNETQKHLRRKPSVFLALVGVRRSMLICFSLSACMSCGLASPADAMSTPRPERQVCEFVPDDTSFICSFWHSETGGVHVFDSAPLIPPVLTPSSVFSFKNYPQIVKKNRELKS